MPKDIRKGMKHLSIRSDERVESKKEANQPLQRERWLYGFHLKNRYFLRIAKKQGLPWKKPDASTFHGVQDYIDIVSRVYYRSETVERGGRPATILYFAEDDQRKRLKKLRTSKKDMDRVRKAIGLRKGTKPKWYDFDGEKEDEGAEVSSDDVDFPKLEWPVVKNPTYGATTRTDDNDTCVEGTADMDCECYEVGFTGVDSQDKLESWDEQELKA